MGKATIISSQGDGLYTIQPQHDTTRAQAEIDRLTARIAEIDTVLPALTTAINDALADLQFAEDKLSAAVSAYRSDPTPENKSAIETVQSGVREAQTQLINARSTKSQAELQKTSAQKQIEFLQANTATPAETSAWCADFSETLSGEVGTIESGRKPGDPPIIRPAGTGGTAAVHAPATDGQIQPIVSGTPWSVFWNAAMRPGAEKWKPRYRIGEITALAGDSCDVTLEAATAGQQSLDVNQASSLTSVPIVYMDCNGAVFEVGDRVVIEFQDRDWTRPRVIGFEDNPRPCGVQGFFSRNGDTLHRLKYEDSAWTGRSLETLKYGNIDWRGHDGDVLSWKGVPSRYFDEDMTVKASQVYSLAPGLAYLDDSGTTRIITRVFQQLPAGTTLQSVIDAGTVGQYIEGEAYFYGGEIYFQGREIVNAGTLFVLGAAIRRAESGDKIIYSIASNYSGTGAQAISEEKFYIADFVNGQAKNARLVETKNHGSQARDYANRTPWFFNASATAATAVRNDGATNQYHRLRLSVDWDAETLSFADLGATGTFTRETSASLTGCGSFSLSGSETIAENITFEFADYHGDVEVVGQVIYSATFSKNGTYDQWNTDPGNEIVCSENMELSSGDKHKSTSSTSSIEIKINGAAIHAETLSNLSGSWDDYLVRNEDGTSYSVYEEWTSSGYSKAFHLTLLDLRSGAYEVQTVRTDITSAYTKWESGSFVTGSTGEKTYSYSAKLDGPDFLDTAAGSSAETTEVPIPEPDDIEIQQTPNWTGGEASTSSTETSNPAAPFGINVSARPIVGKYSFYPGDNQRSFVAVPVAFAAMDMTAGITWAHDSGGRYRYLTGGDPLALTGQEAPGEFNPIGVG